MRRRGFTLIEVVVVLWISTLLMLVTLQLLVRLGRLSDSVESEAAQTIRLGQLSNRFRADAHAALDAELLPSDQKSSPPRLQLQLPAGETIEYAVEGQTIAVTRLKQSKPEGRQTYDLGRAARSTLAVEAARPPRVSLIVAEEPEPTPGSTPGSAETRPSRTYRIDAGVGLDHRFAKGGD